MSVEVVSESSGNPPVACAFPTRPGVAGHILACQLCPASGTYWRGAPTAEVCRYDKPAAEQSQEGAEL
ncbi:hypothetical protein [Micromonospora carbonacea]|uniref:Uncharacterized protein n=1 Tax=Micromonospora carbonacea TaxID=47853 RepID=A0A1C5ACH4_9ACTN|nr:hypothetical protein [Micromonospora carbonacea]SCF42903.1 hypothetical protein GA0070563_112152 [Micromonospora carbonacea]